VRIDRTDGHAYAFQDFVEHYGANAPLEWATANMIPPAEVPLYHAPHNAIMAELQNAPQCRQQKKSKSEKCRQVVTSSFFGRCTSHSVRGMYALKSMCWQVLLELEKLKLVIFFIDSRLKNMGENIPGKGLRAYANSNVLLFDDAGTPILSILLTDLGKEPVVPGSTKNRIQDVIEKKRLKEQDFTETFLRRGHAFAMSDGNEWCKATAWRFGENFAKVVAEREEQKIKQQQRRADKVVLGDPKPLTLKTQVGANDRSKKEARGAPKPRAPKTPVDAKVRPQRRQKASETPVFQSVLPPAGKAPAAHAAALDLGGNGFAIQAAAYPLAHGVHALIGAC
jgi:hypothetical protein